MAFDCYVSYIKFTLHTILLETGISSQYHTTVYWNKQCRNTGCISCNTNMFNHYLWVVEQERAGAERVVCRRMHDSH